MSPIRHALMRIPLDTNSGVRALHFTESRFLIPDYVKRPLKFLPIPLPTKHSPPKRLFSLASLNVTGRVDHMVGIF